MPGLRPEIHREAPADLSDVAEDPALAARIRDEIRADGPMPFARFMELALYDPAGGYYRSEAARPGRGGDFLTAPELHPIFGEVLARAVEQAWDSLDRPEPFVVVEHGAGEGALAVPLLAALPEAIRYRPVEVDERRLARLRARLGDAGLGEAVQPPVEQRLARHLDQRFWLGGGDRPHADAEAGGEDHRGIRRAVHSAVSPSRPLRL